MFRELRSSSMHTPWNYTAAILLLASPLTIIDACVITHSTPFSTPSNTGTVLRLMLLVELHVTTGLDKGDDVLEKVVGCEIGSTWCGMVIEFAFYMLLASWPFFYIYRSCALCLLCIMPSLLLFLLWLLLSGFISSYYLLSSYTYKYVSLIALLGHARQDMMYDPHSRKWWEEGRMIAASVL